jgi:hypothetical protein
MIPDDMSIPSPAVLALSGRDCTGLRPLYCPWPRCPLSLYQTTRSSLRAPSALRTSASGETMTTPGGAGTSLTTSQLHPCSAHRLAPTLRCAENPVKI